MSTRKSGGTEGRIRAKNQAMAARMKEMHITRNETRCGMCHSIVSLAGLYTHLGKCKAGVKSFA